ncbi:Rrf2 family transcriptional regulator [Synechococcales cyanobacterium CNB]|nr:Rrf2 family transcriptional regulator [Synechococcales cyanobacterium CNB]
MISQTAEYALRAAVFLASRATDSPASAQEIAEATRVPVGYLQKILRTLAKHDLLTAHRGTNGGFALAKVPSAISVLDILRASDTPIQRIERCPLGIVGPCRADLRLNIPIRPSRRQRRHPPAVRRQGPIPCLHDRLTQRIFAPSRSHFGVKCGFC